MEASNTGQYSIIRYIAPVNGTYKLNAVFEGVHFGLSSTDVHIMINLGSVFDDTIEGYGGDPAFHQIEGSHPSASYLNTLDMKMNDIITFAVGYGQNKNHYNDTTGLTIAIDIL